MTGTVLVLATALSGLAAGQPAQPTLQFKPLKPLFEVPPQQAPNLEMPRPEQPLVCTRMPVFRGDNRVDPEFVHETPKDVHYTMRRVPGTLPSCPKDGADKK
jgi:hypothetical protein